MKRLLKFLHTTLVGGILFLVPIVVVVIVLEKALGLAHKVVDPLAQKLPAESLIGLQTPMLLAIFMMVLFCFFAGFFARTVIAQKIVNGLESSVLAHLPGYAFLKSTGESMLGVEQPSSFPVVMVRFDDATQIGFQVGEAANGLVPVFIPDAPNPKSGGIYFVVAERITPAGVPLAAAMKCLKRYGAGSKFFLQNDSSGAAAPSVKSL